MSGKTIDEMYPGQRVEYARRVTVADVRAFVDLVGDRNPVHTDPDYARRTVLETPIAPGLFTAGLVAAIIGTELPGPGSIHLSQTLRFVRPVRAGDTITTRVEVAEVLRERERVRLATVCVNQRGEDVLVGEAWVMPARGALATGAPREAVVRAA